MVRKLNEQGYLSTCEAMSKFMRTKDLLVLEHLRANPTKAARAGIPGPKNPNRTRERGSFLISNDKILGTMPYSARTTTPAYIIYASLLPRKLCLNNIPPLEVGITFREDTGSHHARYAWGDITPALPHRG